MAQPIHDNFELLDRLSQLLGEDYDALASEIERDFHGSDNAHPGSYQLSGLERGKSLRVALSKSIATARQKNPDMADALQHINTQLALLIGDYELKQ